MCIRDSLSDCPAGFCFRKPGFSRRIRGRLTRRMWGRKSKHLIRFGKSYLWQTIIILLPHLPSYVGPGGRRSILGVWGGRSPPTDFARGLGGGSPPAYSAESVYISLSGLVSSLYITIQGRMIGNVSTYELCLDASEHDA